MRVEGMRRLGGASGPSGSSRASGAVAVNFHPCSSVEHVMHCEYAARKGLQQFNKSGFVDARHDLEGKTCASSEMSACTNWKPRCCSG